jgi:hypothetical protein
MADAEQSHTDDPQAFDYRRDPEARSDGSPPFEITLNAKRHLQTTVIWMYVWAVLLGALCAFMFFIGVLDVWRIEGSLAAVAGLLLGVLVLGFPLAVLLATAKAFRGFGDREDPLQLARGFRVQFCLLMLPLLLVLLVVAVRVYLFFWAQLTGVYLDV